MEPLNLESVDESLEMILERFVPKIHAIFRIKFKKSYLNSQRNEQAPFCFPAFNLNVNTKDQIYFIETCFEKNKAYFEVYSPDSSSMIISLSVHKSSELRTLKLNINNETEDVFVKGEARQYYKKIHAEQLLMMEIFFEQHVFPELEKIKDVPVSGVVGLTGEQVSQQLEVEGENLGSLVFEDPEAPYSQR